MPDWQPLPAWWHWEDGEYRTDVCSYMPEFVTAEVEDPPTGRSCDGLRRSFDRLLQAFYHPPAPPAEKPTAPGWDPYAELIDLAVRYG